MSDRAHADFQAYGLSTPDWQTARIFSLKLEQVEFGNFRRKYVDAVLTDGKRLAPVLFVFIAEDGTPVLHELHQTLAPALQAGLAKTIADWVAGKARDAHMEADLFETDAALRSSVLQAAESSGRPLPGLAPYDQLFTEAERYANAGPFAIGRSVIDFNPGLGYGIRTLGRLASAIAISPDALLSPAERFVPALRHTSSGADVALYLDAPAGETAAIVERLRSAVREGGRAIVSVRSEEEAANLRGAGASVSKMSRPAADAAGPLDEWLAVFSQQHPAPKKKAQHAAPVRVSERPLRVLFGLRPSSSVAFGGDVVQIRETVDALRARGHTVEISTAARLEHSGFDVVHLSNLTVPGETLPQAQSVRDFDGPVVMMPIFTDHADEAVWGMNASTTMCVLSTDRADLELNLNRIESRSIGGKGWDPPPQRNDIVKDYTALQRATLECVDFLIANAHCEMHRLYRYLSCEAPYAVAPSCANPQVYGTHARAAFVERFGLEDFVLLPGRYEARKNQLLFFEAMRGMSMPVLYIGTNNEAPMAKIFRLRRPGDAVFIGHLPEHELAGAFAAARVVAIPSWSEVVSLTSLNAAISEASMVLSRNGCEHEYFADDAEYCDPASIRSMRDAVQRAWDTHEARAQRRCDLAQRVLRDYTWERSAELTEAAYYRVLALNPRGAQRRVRATRA